MGKSALNRYVAAIRRRAAAHKSFKAASDAEGKSKMERQKAEAEFNEARAAFEIAVGNGEVAPDDLYPADMG